MPEKLYDLKKSICEQTLIYRL